MTLYDVPAPAKLNLFLHVVGRRADGYHLLQTVFRFIDLCDHLSFDVRRDGIIGREGEALAGLAEDDDLVLRAARLLQKATGTQLGAQIRYVKSIPVGGGLGGGSSNAATTLIALNRLWATGLSRRELQALAVQLGADVPVFIFGRNAFAQGVGEVLEPVDLPAASYLLVQPHASLRTQDVFCHASLTRNAKPVTMAVFTDWQTVNAGRSVSCGRYFGRNDLEAVAFALDSGVHDTARWLADQGYPARMTGSGACFFVECAHPDQVQAMKQEISVKMASGESHASRVIRQLWTCSSLPEHPLKYWIRS